MGGEAPETETREIATPADGRLDELERRVARLEDALAELRRTSPES